MASTRPQAGSSRVHSRSPGMERQCPHIAPTGKGCVCNEIDAGFSCGFGQYATDSTMDSTTDGTVLVHVLLQDVHGSAAAVSFLPSSTLGPHTELARSRRRRRARRQEEVVVVAAEDPPAEEEQEEKDAGARRDELALDVLALRILAFGARVAIEALRLARDGVRLAAQIGELPHHRARRRP